MLYEKITDIIPLVQQARMMVNNGEPGNIFAVQGCYLQD